MADTQQVNFLITAVDQSTRVFQSVSSSLQRVEKSFLSLQSIIAGTAVAAFGKQILDATVVAERASARLDAALRATGSSAGIARAELDQMAETLKRSSPFDDDEIRKGISALLRFRDVQADIFRDAARLAPDLAVALDTDLVGAYTRLGRALEDPEKGLRALREAGLNVTSTQERVAKVMKETGDVAEAQRVIIEGLTASIGGAAAAENTGLYGSTKAFGKVWDDLMKAFGRPYAGAASTTLDFVTARLTHIKNIIDDLNLQKVMWLVANPLVGLTMIQNPSQKAAVGPTAAELADARMAAAAHESARLIEQTQAIVDKGIEKIEKEREEREKRLRDEDIKGWVAYVEERQRLDVEELKAIEKIWDEHWEREERLRQEDIKGWVAMAEAKVQTDFEETEQIARDQIESNEKARKAAERLGFTFASAFEDAIVNGEKLRDVLQGLAKDLQRIFVRTTVTEPLAGALASAFAGAFTGGAQIAAQHGADFTVGGSGGVDSQLVRFWATPGEHVSVQTPSQQRTSSGSTFYVDMRGASLDAVLRLEGFVRSIDATLERRAVSAVFDAQMRGARV